jgi:hypothetical protein
VGLDLRGLRRLLLKVNLRNTLDLLGLVLTVHLHLAGWCMKGVLRMLQQVKLPQQKTDGSADSQTRNGLILDS